jgi:NCAIR mutase (PurE)-related protein
MGHQFRDYALPSGAWATRDGLAYSVVGGSLPEVNQRVKRLMIDPTSITAGFKTMGDETLITMIRCDKPQVTVVN